MTAIVRIPELVRSPKLNEFALAEAVLYLLVPWVIVLPWSIVQQVILVAPLIDSSQWFVNAHSSSPLTNAMIWTVWYCVSFLPNLLIGVTYSRRTKAVSLPWALVLGHAMIFYNYLGYVAAWRAFFRMCTGRVSWAKTPRSSEVTDATQSPAVAEIEPA